MHILILGNYNFQMPLLSKKCLDSILSSSCTVDQMQEECHRTCEKIDYIDNPVTYEHFILNYLLPNRYARTFQQLTDIHPWRLTPRLFLVSLKLTM